MPCPDLMPKACWRLAAPILLDLSARLARAGVTPRGVSFILVSRPSCFQSVRTPFSFALAVGRVDTIGAAIGRYWDCLASSGSRREGFIQREPLFRNPGANQTDRGDDRDQKYSEQHG
jgi:hypothetical protein